MDNQKEKLVDVLRRKPYGQCSYEEMADYLIANDVAVYEWISVKDRLPKKNGRYLCRYVFNEYYDMPFEQVLHYFATDKTPHFQNEGSEFGMHVTHWSPLPPSLKGE